MSQEENVNLLDIDTTDTSEDNNNTSPTDNDTGNNTSVGDQEEALMTNSHEWASSLDDSLKKVTSLGKFKDVNSLAKAYVELEKNYGKSPFPGPKSTEEERIAFYRKAGVPDPEKYDLDAKKFGLSDDIAKEIKERASKNGIHPSALQDVLSYLQEKSNLQNEGLAEQNKAVFNEQIESIKKEYGSAFKKYLGLGANVAKEVFSPEEQKYLKETGRFNDPMFVKLLMDRAKGKYGEEMIDDDHTANNVVATPEAINKRIEEILADKDYFDGTSARNKSLVQEMEKLHLAKSKIS